jgi:hypothetical protein
LLRCDDGIGNYKAIAQNIQELRIYNATEISFEFWSSLQKYQVLALSPTSYSMLTLSSLTL